MLSAIVKFTLRSRAIKLEILGEYADYKLCFINPRSGGGAWFANCDPIEVIGDDWNDSSYEHNCGSPYDYRYVNWPENKEHIPVDFVILQYAGNRYETPAERSFSGNSNFSVEGINHKHVAWLAPDNYSEGIKNHPPIYAGTTVQEFIDTMIAAGGIVFLPHTLLGQVLVVEAAEHGRE